MARIELEKCIHLAPRLSDMDSIWAACETTMELMGVDRATLAVAWSSSETREWVWKSTDCPKDLTKQPNSWQVRLEIEVPDRPPSLLCLAGEISDGRLFVLDRADMVWRLRDLLASELPRLERPPLVVKS